MRTPSSSIPISCDECGRDCSASSHSLVGFPGRAWCPVCFGRLVDDTAKPSHRPPAQILDAALRNLEMARDVTAIKLATLRPGSSAHKTTGGYLRGLVDSIQAIKTEMGAK